MSVWIRVQPTGNKSKYYKQQNTMQDTVGQAWLRRKWGIKNLLSIREVPLVVARSPECSCDSTSRIGTSLAASIWHRLSCQCNFSVVIFCALLLAFARLTHRSPINAFLMSNTPWHHWIQAPTLALMHQIYSISMMSGSVKLYCTRWYVVTNRHGSLTTNVVLTHICPNSIQYSREYGDMFVTLDILLSQRQYWCC